jgi:hypothetical protein
MTKTVASTRTQYPPGHGPRWLAARLTLLAGSLLAASVAGNIATSPRGLTAARRYVLSTVPAAR